MYSVGLVGHFEAAHELAADFGVAARLHGHTYRVEITASGNRLDDQGTLVDLGRLRAELDEALGELGYQNLNDLAWFQGLNTTVEVLAEHLHHRLSAAVRALGAETLRVQVWESPFVYAAFDAPVS